MINFDRKAAKDAGYQDEEIDRFISEQSADTTDPNYASGLAMPFDINSIPFSLGPRVNPVHNQPTSVINNTSPAIPESNVGTTSGRYVEPTQSYTPPQETNNMNYYSDYMNTPSQTTQPVQNNEPVNPVHKLDPNTQAMIDTGNQKYNEVMKDFDENSKYTQDYNKAIAEGDKVIADVAAHRKDLENNGIFIDSKLGNYPQNATQSAEIAQPETATPTDQPMKELSLTPDETQQILPNETLGASPTATPTPTLMDQVLTDKTRDIGYKQDNQTNKEIGSWDDFSAMAEEVANELGFPPSVLLGQAALETGRNVENAPGYNYFGIKGEGDAGSQQMDTWEDYGNGPVNITDTFAKYSSPQASVKAYVDTIKRIAPDAMKYVDNPEKMIQSIKDAGYATDPDYVDKVKNQPEFNKSYAKKERKIETQKQEVKKQSKPDETISKAKPTPTKTPTKKSEAKKPEAKKQNKPAQKGGKKKK